MIEIKGLEPNQQSRLLQHYASIKSFEENLTQFEAEHSELQDIENRIKAGETFEGYTAEIITGRLQGLTTQIHDKKAEIENEKQILREFTQSLAEEHGTVDKWIDYVLDILKQVEGLVQMLPQDLQVIVKAVIGQIRKVLEFVKGLGEWSGIKERCKIKLNGG